MLVSRSEALGYTAAPTGGHQNIGILGGYHIRLSRPIAYSRPAPQSYQLVFSGCRLRSGRRRQRQAHSAVGFSYHRGRTRWTRHQDR